MSRSSDLRVLVIGPTPPPFHGVATYVRDLIDNGLGSNVAIQHVDTSDRRDASNLGQWDLENVMLGVRHTKDIGERCLRFRPDFVHLPLSQNLPACLRDSLFILQARLTGSRVVAHLHGGWFRSFLDRSPTWFRLWMRFVLRRTAAVLVLGEGFRNIFTGLVPDGKIYSVPNGVPDPGAWDLRQQQQIRKIPKDGGVLVYLGTLHRDKGLPILFDAVSKLREKRPNVLLRLAGPWHDQATENEFKKRIRDEALENNVEFVGSISGKDKAVFLANADLFCLPTRYQFEGQPLVLLEAMAAGLPIITTRHAVIPETVPHYEAGLLLRKEIDGNDFADSCEELLKDAKWMETMGQAGRKRFLNSYTLQVCRNRLREVLFDAH